MRISVPRDVQIRPFTDRTTAGDSTALVQSMTCKTIQSGKWNFQTLQTVPAPTSLCSPTAHRAALLCSLCAPSCAELRRAAPLALLRLPGCVLMCLLCLLSLPFCLLFSCFMVSPRKKYSFRSVILTAINISCNLLFAVPSLPLKRV